PCGFGRLAYAARDEVAATAKGTHCWPGNPWNKGRKDREVSLRNGKFGHLTPGNHISPNARLAVDQWHFRSDCHRLSAHVAYWKRNIDCHSIVGLECDLFAGHGLKAACRYGDLVLPRLERWDGICSF